MLRTTKVEDVENASDLLRNRETHVSFNHKDFARDYTECLLDSFKSNRKVCLAILKQHTCIVEEEESWHILGKDLPHVICRDLSNDVWPFADECTSVDEFLNVSLSDRVFR